MTDPRSATSALGTSTNPSSAVGEPSAGQVVCEAVCAQVAALQAQEPGVRAALPEAVAEMRVITRALRSTLLGFSRILDRGVTGPIADELKWLAGQLAPERETQVLIELLADDVRALPPHLVVGPVITDLRAAAHHRTHQGGQTITAALDSPRYQTLLGSLEELTTDPPFTRRAGRPAGEELPKSLAKALARLDQCLTQAQNLPPGRARDEALHEARKADKRVRYMSEIIIPLLDEPARRLHHQTEKLQKLLGDNQDSVMARDTLQELAHEAHTQGHSAFTYGLLYGIEYRRAEQALDRLPDRLTRLHDTRTLSWLTASDSTTTAGKP